MSNQPTNPRTNRSTNREKAQKKVTTPLIGVFTGEFFVWEGLGQPPGEEGEILHGEIECFKTVGGLGGIQVHGNARRTVQCARGMVDEVTVTGEQATAISA